MFRKSIAGVLIVTIMVLFTCPAFAQTKEFDSINSITAIKSKLEESAVSSNNVQISNIESEGECYETIYKYSKTLTFPDIEANEHIVDYYDDYDGSYLFTKPFYSLQMWI